MVEVNVPKDIRAFEPTLLFIFTTRQVICGALLLILAYAGYYLEKAMGVPDPLKQPWFVFFGVPPFLFGWIKPYGMHLEDFLWNAFNDNFLSKQNRYYEVDNMWNSILKTDEMEEKQEIRKKGGKVKNVEKFTELPKNKLPNSLKPYK